MCLTWTYANVSSYEVIEVVQCAITDKFALQIDSEWGYTFQHGIEFEPFHYFLRDHMSCTLRDNNSQGQDNTPDRFPMVATDAHLLYRWRKDLG